MLPLMLYTSIVIATSCVNAPASNTDARRLSWLLIQSVKTKSWFCRLVSKLWYNRLYKVFPNGMKDVAKEYYRDNHPFQRYWID
jgi:disulfide oxidoreductase YuzD